MNRTENTGKIVRLGLLTAVLVVMEITGIGLLKTPSGLELTILQIPVLIGAIIMGPAEGAVLGGVFGLISFYECFGKSPFGSALLGINPVFTFIVCFVPRVLMGLCCGLIFKALNKNKDGKSVVPFGISSFCGAALNTVFFMTTLICLFGSSDYIMAMRGTMNIFKFIAAFVGLQGVIEAVLCTVVGTVLSKAVWKVR